MRITNGILINNSLTNINTNKTTLDELNTQLASERKIQRPSDDPIIAIRALRFRTTLLEIEQYLVKNISDAESWMTSTDEAMDNIVGILGDVTEYCNQAVNGYYDTTNKNTIVENLRAFRDQMFSDANADCAGRTIFTGYKTDGTLTFLEDNKNKYEITQKFSGDNLDIISKVTNSLDVSQINDTTIGTTNVSAMKLPTQVQAYRLRLAYDKTDSASGAVLELNDGTSITTTTKKSTDAGVYEPGDNEAYFLADTGELILGKNIYSQLLTAPKDANGDAFKVTYTREGFKKGELDPIQYFDCIDKTDADASKWITYTNRNQEITYEVNFNQTIKINTQGKDVFTQDMTRDLDDIINAVNYALEVESRKDKIQELYDHAEDESAEKSKYKDILDLCDRELDMAKDNMKKAFSNGMGCFTKHHNIVSLARTDVGARLKRLELNKNRLEAQQTTVTKLKSVNEEVNTAQVGIEITEAESIYDASLIAASKVVQKKLLDFI